MAALHRGPTLSPVSLLARGPGFDRFVESHTDAEYAYYRSGKWAFRDALDLTMAARGGTEVVLPAYVPDGFVEPIREAGLTPRFHRMRPDLRPDLGDVRSLVDGDTLAVVSVGYFGQPQPIEVSEALRSLCDAHGAVLVDDAAHGAFSVGEGGLVGTVGHLGFTSLHKALPIPDGAVLYVADEALGGALPRSAVASRPTPADLRYLTRTVLTRARRSIGPATRRRISGPSSPTPSARNPAALYRRSKGEMSWLSARVARRVDPAAIRRRRRENYAVWELLFAERPGLAQVYPSLGVETCPQYYPTVLTDLAEPVAALGRPWPPLPDGVRGNDRFVVTNHLAARLYTFPVHQELRPSGIEAAVEHVVGEDAATASSHRRPEPAAVTAGGSSRNG
ncbi:DegT/DnrJ/EryC1/StrS family aminotransferase [Natronorarus salvus]|uniref:DegT/DnrJ/EryC1/StrS family aminotransferase n=1 Tax=Natronorarus salvus TaxID=3117733 RepID=UPI002F261AC8